jgi:hypothetical protein
VSTRAVERTPREAPAVVKPPRRIAEDPSQWAQWPTWAHGPDDGPGLLHTATERVLSRARSVLGQKSLRRTTRKFTDDCGGYILWALSSVHGAHRLLAGSPAEGLFDVARDRGALHFDNPAPGELVFFRETYDRNRDGKRNDGITHVGFVEEVRADGTVYFLHRANSGVKRSSMNVAKPNVKREGGEELNDVLRSPKAGKRAYLTGELFAGYATTHFLYDHAPALVAAAPRIQSRSRLR